MGIQYVYDFSEGGELGRELLGGKGAGLAEMTAIGLPVPAGFTVTTEACREYMRLGRAPGRARRRGATRPSRASRSGPGKRFGDPADPLLVSVRSGAAVSMPGMMDTILNLGLNDEAVEGLARATGNERFAFDAYRRLVQMFGDVVAGVDGQLFEQALTSLKAERGVTQDVELGAERPAGAGRPLRGALRRLPAGRARPARARRPGRLRLLGDAARAGLQACQRHPGRARHGRQRRADGLREQGRRLGHGRRLHPRPVDRRARPLGRVPRQRAGRGRGRRHPHAGADRRHAAALSRGVRAAQRDDGAPRGALPRDAGHRVHGRGGHALPAPDAHREAHGRSRAPHCRRHGLGRAADAGRGCRAGRPAPARPAAPPDDRPGGRLRGRRKGPERLAGRCDREDRARRRPGPGAGKAPGRRSSSSAPRRRPTTSTASSRRGESLRPTEA